MGCLPSLWQGAIMFSGSTKHARTRRFLFTAIVRVTLILLALFILAGPISARAGGAGGSHSSGSSSSSRSYGGNSGSGSGDLMIVVYLVSSIVNLIGPIPTLILAALIVFALYRYSKHKNHQASNVYANMASRGSGNGKGMGAFKKRNPGFDEAIFKQKVTASFMAIQQAWSSKNLASVRRFISDGVYQRFSTQFAMMNILKQENKLSNVHIESISIDKAEQEGSYDILTVAITASMSDRFVCDTNHSLDQSSHDSFVEYWSFIRKGKTDQTVNQEDAYKDIFTSNNCPACSAPLPDDLGERGQCPYCNALVNSGIYDWVLSEITQSDDYAADRVIEKSLQVSRRLKDLHLRDPDFCIQLLEDKASNAYLQILAATVAKKPDMMRRFSSDRAYQKIQTGFPDANIIFNRLYLNQVTLIGANLRSDTDQLSFSIGLSFQRVLLENNRAKLIDPIMRRRDVVVVMQRSNTATSASSKGNLYLHQCPACGASAADSTDLVCTYCGSAHNAPNHEWIVDDLLDLSEWVQTSHAEESTGTVIKIKTRTLENLFDIRDYAMNNFMVLIASDGVFASEEREMAAELAKKLGYRIADMEAMFSLAASGRMSLRMPFDLAKRQKILALLEEAAQADGRISSEEQAILDYIREESKSL